MRAIALECCLGPLNEVPFGCLAESVASRTHVGREFASPAMRVHFGVIVSNEASLKRPGSHAMQPS
jgi:hypothetical protein